VCLGGWINVSFKILSAVPGLNRPPVEPREAPLRSQQNSAMWPLPLQRFEDYFRISSYKIVLPILVKKAMKRLSMYTDSTAFCTIIKGHPWPKILSVHNSNQGMGGSLDWASFFPSTSTD
jgi:hypothetical protein